MLLPIPTAVLLAILVVILVIGVLFILGAVLIGAKSAGNSKSIHHADDNDIS